jgi:hypothetical protein
MHVVILCVNPVGFHPAVYLLTILKDTIKHSKKSYYRWLC